MEMKTYWEVATRYDRTVMDDWQARSHFHTIAHRLGIRVKWMSAQSTPTHWIGYTANNPSPGYPIDQHFWKIEDEDQAALFHLTCGSKIRKVEVNDG
jgi:hypothetical protein